MDENHPRTGHRCPGFITTLVLRCGQGDESALVVLMELLYAPVRARLSVTAPANAEAEADELVARAFVHIWHRSAAYDASNQEGVIAWLLDEAVSALGLTTPRLTLAGSFAGNETA